MFRVPSLVLLGVLALLLAACAQPAAPTPTAKPTEPPKPVPAASPAPAASPVASPSPAAAAPAKPSGPLAKIRVTQAAATLAFLPTNVGRALGYFAEEGFEVEQVSTGGGGPDLQALLAGEAQFTQGAGTYQADAFRQGRKVFNVFNYLNKNVVNSAIHVDAAKEKGITEKSTLQEKLAAIRGLKLGGTRPGALTFQQAEYVVRLAGFTPQNETQVIGAGEGPALIAALENRQVDVIFQTIPVPEQAVARGKAIMFINNAAGEDPSLVPFNMENVFTTPELVERDPALVQRFVRAIKKSNDFIVRSSPEQIADAIKDDEFFKNTERAVLIAGLVNIKAATNASGLLDKKAVENTLKMQQQALNVDEVFALFTDRFVRAAT
jgi:NitT/TauT family transport system substrate-binding protein